MDIGIIAVCMFYLQNIIPTYPALLMSPVLHLRMLGQFTQMNFLLFSAFFKSYILDNDSDLSALHVALLPNRRCNHCGSPCLVNKMVYSGCFEVC